jgi:hypothetical protein
MFSKDVIGTLQIVSPPVSDTFRGNFAYAEFLLGVRHIQKSLRFKRKKMRFLINVSDTCK